MADSFMARPIRNGDTYSTPAGSAGVWASRFSSLTFLWKILGIIRHDGNLATQGSYTDERWWEGSGAAVRALESCGVHIHVEGMDNIDSVDGPCIFIANHMSTLETFVLPFFIQPRKTVTFVVKQSLIDYPWFGAVLRSRNPIVVSRSNPRKDFVTVMEQGQERLEKGISLIIFPQSTRSTSLEPGQFNSIGIKLAKKTGVPVIPVALRTDAWGMGKIVKDFGPIRPDLPVRFAFGAPVTVTDNGKKEHQQVLDFIDERLKSWFLPVKTA